MKPATIAPLPRPKLPATRRSAIEEARCSAETRVRLRTWFAVFAIPKPGAADGRADEGLPGTVDECEARVAQCAREIAGDQDRLGTETIEQRTRQGRYERRRAHDRRQHQPRGRRREAAGLVQVDDLEGKDQPSAEVVDRGPGLKNDDRPRQARPPAGEHTSERPAHLLPAVGCRRFHRQPSWVVSSCCGTIGWADRPGRSVVHTPRHCETGRPRAAQIASWAVYIPGGGTTCCGK